MNKANANISFHTAIYPETVRLSAETRGISVLISILLSS